MKFDVFINSILKEENSINDKVYNEDGDEVSSSVGYVMKEYGLSYEEVYVMIEDFENDPNFWDYFCSLRNEQQVNSLMKEIDPELYQKRLKRIQDKIDRDAFKGTDLEDFIDL
jgi:hypothetical protein